MNKRELVFRFLAIPFIFKLNLLKQLGILTAEYESILLHSSDCMPVFITIFKSANKLDLLEKLDEQLCQIEDELSMK